MMQYIHRCIGQDAKHVLSDREIVALKQYNAECRAKHVMVMRNGKLRMVKVG